MKGMLLISTLSLKFLSICPKLYLWYGASERRGAMVGAGLGCQIAWVPAVLKVLALQPSGGA
jgi:hypothetical protein